MHDYPVAALPTLLGLSVSREWTSKTKANRKVGPKTKYKNVAITEGGIENL